MNVSLEFSITPTDYFQLASARQSRLSLMVRRAIAAFVLVLSFHHLLNNGLDWEFVGIGEKTVQRVRQKFVREGMVPSLQRKKRSTPGTTPKFDGRTEAQLVTLCCLEPPYGRQRWTLQLLVDELCRLQVAVDSRIVAVITPADFPANLFVVREIDLRESRRVNDELLEMVRQLGGVASISIGQLDHTETGLAFLFEIPGLQRVKVNDTEITNRDHAYLSQLKKLSLLELQGCTMSTEQLTALRAAIPSCRVIVHD